MADSRLERLRPEDGVPAWRLAYERLLAAGVDYGRQFGFDELAALLDIDAGEFRDGRRARLYRVLRELERSQGRTLLPVPGEEAYRVSHPEQHAAVCQARQARGRRLNRRALALIQATDVAALSDEGRERLRNVERGLVVMAAVVGVHECRLNRIERALREAGMKL